MLPPHCQVLVTPPSYDWVQAELHSHCGVEWADINLAHGRKQPLQLDFDLHGPDLERTVCQLRSVLDLAEVHEVELSILVGEERHSTSPTQLEQLLGQLRPHPKHPTVVINPHADIQRIASEAIREAGLESAHDELLPLVRPFLAVPEGRPWVSADAEIPVGASKLFGHPDLQEGAAWPRQKDCTTRFLPDVALDPTMLCSFIAQIDLADLACTTAARYLPSAGLLSFFAAAEYENEGTIDALVQWVPPTSRLDRLTPPKERWSEDNILRRPQRLQLEERPALPQWESPHLAALRESGLNKGAYDELMMNMGSMDCGLLGYSDTSRAGDVSESSEWHQFAHWRTAAGHDLHFHLSTAALEAKAVHLAKLVYAHPD